MNRIIKAAFIRAPISVFIAITCSLLRSHSLMLIHTSDYFIINNQVSFLLSKLKSKSATGPDIIPCRLLKFFSTTIAPSLSSLFNLSIAQGKLPSLWKISNLVPIPKGTSKNRVENYCPISLLPVVSKILERHIYSLLLEHFTQ